MDNPVYAMATATKTDQLPQPPAAVVNEKDQTKSTSNYARFDTNSNFNMKQNGQDALNRHLWLLPYCTLIAVMVAFGTTFGLVAVSVELRRTYAAVESNRELIHGQELKILNGTLKLGKSEPAPSGVSPDRGTGDQPQAKGTVFYHWGLDTCPGASTTLYSGVAASGSSSYSTAKGGGSNYLCMVPDPVYAHSYSAVNDARSRIFGAEYRNGASFGTQTDLHCHDVPCAACLTGAGRQTMIMMPGKMSCPDDTWTLEYFGYIMAARHNLMRTEYICVTHEAAARPGTMTYDETSSLLFPVEGICGTGGGLPCTPYINEMELTCAVCSK